MKAGKEQRMEVKAQETSVQRGKIEKYGQRGTLYHYFFLNKKSSNRNNTWRIKRLRQNNAPLFLKTLQNFIVQVVL